MEPVMEAAFAVSKVAIAAADAIIVVMLMRAKSRMQKGNKSRDYFGAKYRAESTAQSSSKTSKRNFRSDNDMGNHNFKWQ